MEEDGADHFLQNLNQQFKPETPSGIVPPSGPWKPEPVLAEGRVGHGVYFMQIIHPVDLNVHTVQVRGSKLER